MSDFGLDATFQVTKPQPPSHSSVRMKTGAVIIPGLVPEYFAFSLSNFSSLYCQPLSQIKTLPTGTSAVENFFFVQIF